MLKKVCLVLVAVMLAVCGSIDVRPVLSDAKVATVTEVKSASAAPAKESSINGARFLNMLNHSFVYGEDFDDINTIVNNSTIALLDMADDEGFINETYVAEYLNNMYGLTVDNLDQLNAELGYKEGFVFVIPRGYTTYEHRLVDITLNEDGTYTVVTKVSADSHDSGASNLTAVTHFVENSDSMFGYNIISSKLIEGAFSI